MNIIGKSQCISQQMSQYLLSVNKYPKFSTNISALDFCQLFIDICAKENVRGDVAFAQSCLETGNFAYGGDVKCTQNNFSGLGATGNGVCGCIFSSIEEGILAQAQHLKTYATKSPLNEPCVDPRRTTWFVNAKGGTSPDVETLSGIWAVPGYNTTKYKSLDEAHKAKDTYGHRIVNIVDKISQIKVVEDKKFYRVQVGAFSVKENAINLENKLKQLKFETYIKQIDNLYKVQIGAYANKENADAMLKKVKKYGFNAFITYY